MASTSASFPSFMAVLVLFFSLLTLVKLRVAEPPPPLSGCADELVRFSPCLPYVSLPPNNLSESSPPKCCDTFSSSFESGAALCLCHLIQDPPMLGFPVNDSRVLSLSSVCPLSGDFANTKGANSLESLCLASPELPPLRSSVTPAILSPPPPGVDNASSPLMSSPPESTDNPNFLPGMTSPLPLPPPPPPTPPSSALESAMASTATKQISKSNTWFLLALLIFLESFLQ